MNAVLYFSKIYGGGYKRKMQKKTHEISDLSIAGTGEEERLYGHYTRL